MVHTNGTPMAVKLEIRNLTCSERLSDETLCYAATVYVNGERAFAARNQGFGGPDEYVPFSPRGAELLELVERYAASLPRETLNVGGGRSIEMPVTLESLVGAAVDKKRAADWLKRLCRSNVVFTLPGDAAGQYRTVKIRKGASAGVVIAWLRGKHPEAQIVNGTV